MTFGVRYFFFVFQVFSYTNYKFIIIVTWKLDTFFPIQNFSILTGNPGWYTTCLIHLIYPLSGAKYNNNPFSKFCFPSSTMLLSSDEWPQALNRSSKRPILATMLPTPIVSCNESITPFFECFLMTYQIINESRFFRSKFDIKWIYFYHSIIGITFFFEKKN